MTIPFNPKTLLDHQQRLPGALDEIFDHAAMECGGQFRPGQSAQHYFDFASGLRLLIWRERRDGGISLQVSAYVEPGSELERMLAELREYYCERCVLGSFLQQANSAWFVLTGRKPLKFWGIDGGVAVFGEREAT